MDANGLRFWSLASEGEWHRWGDPPSAQYDRDRRTLTLASERSDLSWPDQVSEAVSRVERVPQSVDQYGTRAFWHPGSREVRATGALASAIAIFIPPTATTTVTDLAIGYDGVLYIALGGAIVLVDRRGRWEPVFLEREGFSAWRLAADPSGGVWILDREHRQLGRVLGQPRRLTPRDAFRPDVVRPCPENPDPPRLVVYDDATWPEADQPVAIACSREGRLALLAWRAPEAEADARVRMLGTNGRFEGAVTLQGARHPYSMAWLSTTRIAVMLPGRTGEPVPEAPVYAMELSPSNEESVASSARPLGDYYPLRDHDRGPFAHGVAGPPRYGTTDSTAPLVRLSLPTFLREGEVSGTLPFDSGQAQTIWHRLYVEAMVPPQCGARILLAATEDFRMPLRTSGEWHEHHLGDVVDPDARGEVPRAAWVRDPSELPFHEGVLPCEPAAGRSGLFTILIQRPRRRVRTLKGRYLWVRVVLSGNGRATPEIAALRAYASRFSYLNRYLPELYREQVFGPDADRRSRSTPADFLERFLDNFEGILTPLEDRIANSYLLTDPDAAPEDALDWLASWVGLTFDPAYPKDRRRALLQATPDMYRSRGTLRGLSLALETATGGGVSGGEIVILEDYRLRRTVATILGADLADEDDPLLAGRVSSGNSVVGDTLVLGDEHRKEFLALFSADLDTTAAEDAAIARLFDDLAHRVTVLVHAEVEDQDLGLIRRIVALETPAHVSSRVISARYSFLVGMASLVGVDTYLAQRAGRAQARVGQSRLGVKDFVQRPASLDPRLEGGREGAASVVQPPPIARLDAPGEVSFGDAITLDARDSRAVPPRVIVRHDWRMPE
jgi:phage tail-like protein